MVCCRGIVNSIQLFPFQFLRKFLVFQSDGINHCGNFHKIFKNFSIVFSLFSIDIVRVLGRGQAAACGVQAALVGGVQAAVVWGIPQAADVGGVQAAVVGGDKLVRQIWILISLRAFGGFGNLSCAGGS